LFDDPARPCVVPIDRSKRKALENSVVVCGACGGAQGNYPSLAAFIEAYQADPSVNKKKQKTASRIYPATVPLINKMMRERCPVPFEELSENSNFQFTPPSAVEKIVENRITQAVIKTEVSARKQHLRELRNSTPYTFIVLTRDKREMLSEQQNHRCCYCSTKMLDINRHPLSPTWEHVLAVKDGGGDTWENLVIACSACNGLRNSLDLSALDYFDWVWANLAEFREIIRVAVKKFEAKERYRKWKRDYIDRQAKSA
jgi:5-methylcytosine-specific restriction endonuclease McrA